MNDLELVAWIATVVAIVVMIRPLLWWFTFSKHLSNIRSKLGKSLGREALLYYLYLRQRIFSIFQSGVSSRKSMEDMLEEIAREMAELFGCDSWSIILTPQGKDWSFIAWSKNLDKVNLREISKHIQSSEKNNIKDVMESKDLGFIPDTLKIKQWGEHDTPVRTWIGVPLIVNDVVIGVINLDWFRPSAAKQYVLETLREIIPDLSRILDSFEEFRDMVFESDLDVLLRIPNRGAFDRFSRHIEREGARVGFLLIDIDNFKRFNDVYGHTMGNELLKNIAKRISDNIRKEDRLFRYGGDEFVIVVDNPTGEVLRSMERKLHHVFLKIFDVGRGDKRFFAKINVKIGFAIYPDEADSVVKALDLAEIRANKL